MRLLELYDLTEMARTREDPTWKMLDWASQQGDKEFTLQQALKVYNAAGGQSNEHQFTTIFRKLVGHDPAIAPKEKWKDPSYAISEERPIAVARYGRRGKGGQYSYRWGLDGPLREPPSGGPVEVEDDAVGDALDKLEGHMGGIELKKRLAFWRTLGDMNSVMRSVMTLPARMRAEAMLVASQHLVTSGKADPEEVDDAERRIASRTPASAATTGTPFSPGRPRADLPAARGGRSFRPAPPAFDPRPGPESEPDDAVDDPAAEWDDDPADKTDPQATSPFADVGEPQRVEPEAPGEDEEDLGDEAEAHTPEGTELRAVLRYGDSMSRGRVVWRRGEAVVTDEGGRRVPPNSGVELQTLGDEQFEGEYAGMMEWLAENWPKLINPPSEGGPDLEAELGGEPEEGGEEESTAEGDVIDTADYPDFLPPANSGGSPGEQAMYRLVDLAQNGGADLGAADTLWDLMEANDDEAAAENQIKALFASPGYPKKFLKDALAVSKEVISGQASSDEKGVAPVESFPDWTPAADEGGSAPEQAMYRLVNDHGVNADDPLWDALTHAADETDLRRITMANWRGRPKAGFRDALAVGSFGLDNAFESPEEYEADGESEEGNESEAEEPSDDGDGDGKAQEAPPTGQAAAIPSWLPTPNAEGLGAEEAMADILDDMPKASGFGGFDGSHPIFAEIRGAKDINDAYTVILRNGVPRIMVKKFLRVARAIFDHDGRDPETGAKVQESVRTRLLRMMEAAMGDCEDDCEDDEVPDPSKRGSVGSTRLLPMYGMDEGPNTDPVDFAPKRGLTRIMRLGRRDR